MKFIRKIKNWNPSNYATILILLLPFSYFAITKYKLDNDFWFLINTGKTILEKGFILVEPFTIHENFAFIPQQWLTDIIFYLIYSKFNIEGFLIFELMINFLIIFLLYKSCFLVSKRKNISIFIAFILDSLLLIGNILTSRPQMFDIILFLLELFLIESYIKNKKNNYLYFIPLISLLLINLHASMWLMFFVLLIPYYIEYIIKKIRKEETFPLKSIFIVTIISFLFGFINPYHINSILYLFNSYGIQEINNVVGEMKPVVITSNCMMYIFIFMVLYLFYINKGKNKIRYVLLFLGTTYLTLSHYKGLLIWIVCIAFIISEVFKSNKKVPNIELIKQEKIIYCILIIGFVLLVSFNIKFEREPKLKIIADYLDKNTSKDIRLFTGYNNGSYLEYRGYKCYMDTRAEVFLKTNNKKEDIFKEYYKLNSGYLDAEFFLKKYNFDYLIVDEYDNYLVIFLEKNNNYEKVLEVKDKDLEVTYKLYRRINEEVN